MAVFGNGKKTGDIYPKIAIPNENLIFNEIFFSKKKRCKINPEFAS
jgi:hypothetical protein